MKIAKTCKDFKLTFFQPFWRGAFILGQGWSVSESSCEQARNCLRHPIGSKPFHFLLDFRGQRRLHKSLSFAVKLAKEDILLHHPLVSQQPTSRIAKMNTMRFDDFTWLYHSCTILEIFQWQDSSSHVGSAAPMCCCPINIVLSQRLKASLPIELWCHWILKSV